MADDQQQDTGAEVNDAPQMTDVEVIAHEKGWRPRDQFKGNEGEWRDAAEFLRKMPGTRDLKREVSDMRRSIEGIERASKLAYDRDLKAEQAKIQARFTEAVENKDAKGAAQAADDMRSLAQEQRDDSPEQRFAADNDWYGKDEDATAYAISVSQREAARGASVDAQLKAARSAVEKRFPELFEDNDGGDDAPKAKPKTLTLNTPTRNLGAPKAKGFAEMPAAAKSAAERFFNDAKTRGTQKEDDRDKFMARYAKDFYAEAAE